MSVLARRRLLIAGVASLVTMPAVARVPATPRQTEGPFYPDVFPPDIDGDLVCVAGVGRPAHGEILDLGGRVADVSGAGLPGILVEIWQCDATGRYHHVGRPGGDPGFQGYGRVVSALDGSYAFRTIRPVPYTGRTPHIHVKLRHPAGPTLTTQLYVAGEARNADDFLYRRLDPAQRAAVTASLLPAGGGKAVWRARIDLVVPWAPPRIHDIADPREEPRVP